MKTNDNYVLLILFNGHWGWRVRRPPSSSSTNHLTEETAVEVPPFFKGIFLFEWHTEKLAIFWLDLGRQY
jgi:hypothetical protein